VPAIPSVARPAPGLPSASKPAPTAARPLAPLPKPGPKLPSAAPPSAERAAIATGDDALAAAQAARNADLALQKGDLAGAEDAARLAMEKDPNQQEYQALLAWIHSRRDPKRSPQALAVFDRILAASPELERVILYRARVRRELGQGSGAIDDYELLLDLNPLHVEATREILESKRNPGRE
jgi:tetratricopeptide (TPR) repeat protein